jgi:hypothetical protein
MRPPPKTPGSLFRAPQISRKRMQQRERTWCRASAVARSPSAAADLALISWRRVGVMPTGKMDGESKNNGGGVFDSYMLGTSESMLWTWSTHRLLIQATTPVPPPPVSLYLRKHPPSPAARPTLPSALATLHATSALRSRSPERGLASACSRVGPPQPPVVMVTLTMQQGRGRGGRWLLCSADGLARHPSACTRRRTNRRQAPAPDDAGRRVFSTSRPWFTVSI